MQQSRLICKQIEDLLAVVYNTKQKVLRIILHNITHL